MDISSRYRIRRRRAVPGVVLALLLTCLPSLGLAGSGASDGAFYIARFEHQISDASRAALASTGVTIVGYEPEDSYVVWGDTQQIRRARRSPVIDSVSGVPASRKMGVAPTAAGTDGVNVVTVRSAADRLAEDLDLAGMVRRVDPLDQTLSTVSIVTSPSDLDAIASRPDVLYIEPVSLGLDTEDEMTTQIVAGNLADDGRGTAGYQEWLDKLGLTGKGVRVSIVDTGISEDHPDIAGRIVQTYDYSEGAIKEAPYDTGGHGTHVAGIVAGQPSGSGPLYSDPEGLLYGQGVAPEAQLINQNIIGQFGPGTGGEDNHVRFRGYAKDAVKAGARIWNASWHTGQGNRMGYLASVRVFDELTRDVVAGTKAAEDFLFVFSAGNTGASGPTVPKEAKNIIAVGSTMSGRGLQYPQKSNPEMVSSTSSVGPTKDGRIYPTVAAPGGNVVSARSIEGSTIGCATPVDAIVYYCVLSGTSMAAPHVAGSAALIHQWWKRERGELPSPAMVKSLLVNSATDIGIPDIPNNFEGWGRVNLSNLFAPGPRTMVDQSATFDRSGQSRSYEVDLSKKGPLKITLAWSDAPATVGAEKVLVNDLDLVVERVAGGRVLETYRGNVFAKGSSIKGGQSDRLNNLENVFLLGAPPGTYRVTVEVANLPGDGVPNNSDRTDQDFALVIDGAR